MTPDIESLYSWNIKKQWGRIDPSKSQATDMYKQKISKSNNLFRLCDLDGNPIKLNKPKKVLSFLDKLTNFLLR